MDKLIQGKKEELILETEISKKSLLIKNKEPTLEEKVNILWGIYQNGR